MSSTTTRLRRRLQRTAHTDAGFTLLEVIVSFVIFAIVAGGATVGIMNALKASHVSQQRVDAANIAQADIANDIAGYHSGTMPSSTSTPYTAAVQGEQFSVSRTVSPTSCTSGQTFTVSVVVKQAQTQTFLAQSDTVIAC